MTTEVVISPPPGESLPANMRSRLSSAGQLLGREEGRTAAVYLLSLSTNILCWAPLVISRIWPTSLPSLLVTLPALSYTIVSPVIFACRCVTMSGIWPELKDGGGGIEGDSTPVRVMASKGTFLDKTIYFSLLNFSLH